VFFEKVLNCLQINDPQQKTQTCEQLWREWQSGHFGKTDFHQPLEHSEYEVGHPQKPRLVHPRELPKRSVHTPQGIATMVHAFAHIEFNAINLALDAVYRFRGLPAQYYDDWLRIAAEEAYHFKLLQGALHTRGFHYGDFDAHNGLWDMAMRTAHDPLVRMAVIPRGLEARGLDVTPAILEKFRAVQENDLVQILEIILRDEIGHVHCGTYWFNYLCERDGVSSQETFERLVRQYGKEGVKSPLHRQARIQAGFSEAELLFLEGLEGLE